MGASCSNEVVEPSKRRRSTRASTQPISTRELGTRQQKRRKSSKIPIVPIAHVASPEVLLAGGSTMSSIAATTAAGIIDCKVSVSSTTPGTDANPLVGRPLSPLSASPQGTASLGEETTPNACVTTGAGLDAAPLGIDVAEAAATSAQLPMGEGTELPVDRVDEDAHPGATQHAERSPVFTNPPPRLSGTSTAPGVHMHVATLRHSGALRVLDRCWNTPSRADGEILCCQAVYMWCVLWGADASDSSTLLRSLADLQYTLSNPPRLNPSCSNYAAATTTITPIPTSALQEEEAMPTPPSIGALHEAFTAMCGRHQVTHDRWQHFQDYVAQQQAQSVFGHTCDMAQRHAPSEVLPGFFLGSYHTVVSGAALAALGISAVVSCVGQLVGPLEDEEVARGGGNFVDDQWRSDDMTARRGSAAETTTAPTTSAAATYSTHDGVAYCNMELRDQISYPIQHHFVEATSFLRTMFFEQRRRVLVVCGVGVSRAPTIAVAFLCHLFGMDVALALSLVRAIRPQVKPNDAFLIQLLRCYSPQLLPTNLRV